MALKEGGVHLLQVQQKLEPLFKLKKSQVHEIKDNDDDQPN